MKERDQTEQGILMRVAISLWLIIVFVMGIAFFLKDFLVGGFREGIFVATSIITQIYITNPEYGFFIFLFAFFGKILIIYIIYILILLFSEGLFKQSLQEGKIMRNIKQLKDHYIVCGGGRVGSNVAVDLIKSKKNVVIIDRDAETITAFKKRKILAILGDSLDSEVLKQAGINKAKAVISCLDSDGDNMLQIIVAKKMNKKVKIVSRASHEKFIDNLKNVGANDIIIPEIIGGQKMAQAAIKFK